MSNKSPDNKKYLDLPVWTALITPFQENGSVHLKDLVGLIRRQDGAENGVLLFGSTGEGLALSTREKREILQEVSTLSLRVPLMIGVGGSEAAKQIAWIEECNTAPIDAFLLVAPPYAKPGEAGMVRWFHTLMEHSEHPCMIYNIPSRSGVKITPAVLNQLTDHPNCWAVKEASGNIREYCEFTRNVPDLTFYAGDDFMVPFFSRVGTQGVVSVASNVWPLQTRQFVQACFDSPVVPQFHEWNDAVTALFSAPNPIPVKALMKLKGFIESDRLRLPLVREDFRDQDLQMLRKADAVMKQWLFRGDVGTGRTDAPTLAGGNGASGGDGVSGGPRVSGSSGASDGPSVSGSSGASGGSGSNVSDSVDRNQEAINKTEEA